MKTAEWHQRGRSGDFQFKVWISQFRMGGYFLKTFFPKQLN